MPNDNLLFITMVDPPCNKFYGRGHALYKMKKNNSNTRLDIQVCAACRIDFIS